jgi:hypothetical protein
MGINPNRIIYIMNYELRNTMNDLIVLVSGGTLSGTSKSHSITMSLEMIVWVLTVIV